MSNFYSKALFASMLIGASALSATAADFPVAKIVSPVRGVSMFSTVGIVWNYENFQEGPEENRMITIKTPSGEELTAKAYTEFVLEDDKGGTMDQSSPDGSNALMVSYYNQLIKAGNPTGSFVEKGVYTLTVPAGAISIDGVQNPEVTLTYDLGYLPEMEPATYEFVYQNEVAQLLITWNNQKVEKTRVASAGLAGYLNGENLEEEIELASANFSLIEDNTVLRVNLSGRVEEGKSYVFTLPGGQLQNEAEDVNPEQDFNFVATSDAGVETIISDSSSKVYNLNGVKVLDKGDVTDLQNLPAGIYILNGKKVIVK